MSVKAALWQILEGILSSEKKGKYIHEVIRKVGHTDIIVM